MAIQRRTETQGGWEQYRRFSELIFLSVSGHLVFGMFYGFYLNATAIGLSLTLPSLLVLSLIQRRPRPAIGAMCHSGREALFKRWPEDVT